MLFKEMGYFVDKKLCNW